MKKLIKSPAVLNPIFEVFQDVLLLALRDCRIEYSYINNDEFGGMVFLITVGKVTTSLYVSIREQRVVSKMKGRPNHSAYYFSILNKSKKTYKIGAAMPFYSIGHVIYKAVMCDVKHDRFTISEQ